jgi:hypothetical protein
MQALICYPRGIRSDAEAALRTLVKQRGWNTTPAFSTDQFEDARDYREWLLFHERQAQSPTWRSLIKRPFDVFVGFGSASALFAALFPQSRKIVIVERLESAAFARKSKRELPEHANRIDLQLPFHQRVEADLLRTFDRVLCSRELAQTLRQHGWSDDGKLISVDGHWSDALERGIAGNTE